MNGTKTRWILLSIVWVAALSVSKPNPALSQDLPLEVEACGAAFDRQGEPSLLRVDSPLSLRMTLEFDCSEAFVPSDIVFVIDRSSWLGTPGFEVSDTTRLEELAKGLDAFLDREVGTRGSTLGLITYDSGVQVLQSQTSDRRRVRDKLDRLRVGGDTRRPDLGLDRARTQVRGSTGKAVVVLMGGNEVEDEQALERSAKRILNDGATLVVLETRAILENDTLYRDLVPSGFYSITGPDRPAYDLPWLKRNHLGLGVTGLSVFDRLSPLLAFERSVGMRSPIVEGQDLRWEVLQNDGSMPPGGYKQLNTALQYNAKAIDIGQTRVGDPVFARLRFSNGAEYDLTFPPVEIEILPARPSSTPTATWTPTATPTPLPPSPTATPPPTAEPRFGAYLPSLFKNDSPR
jgi:hypothetical protein